MEEGKKEGKERKTRTVRISFSRLMDKRSPTINLKKNPTPFFHN
jgi:hypothetical protein